MSSGVNGRFGGAKRVAQGLGFGLAVAWSTQSCKTPTEEFECSTDDECKEVVGSGQCHQRACFYPDGRCQEGWRSRGQCTSDPNRPGSGGASSGGGSSSDGGGSGGGTSGGSPGSGNGGSSGGSGDGGSASGGASGTGSAPSTNPDGGPSGGEGLTVVAGTIGGRGGIDGLGPLARFASPGCLAFDGARYLYVGDEDIHTIRRVDTNTGEVTTIAGYPFSGWYKDDKGTEARFVRPECVSYDGSDAANPVLYVAEWTGNRIRKIALKDGTVTLLAGSPLNELGHVDAAGDLARFNGPEGMARRGNFLYVTDAYNNALRAINLTTRAVTTVIGDVATQASGTTDGPIATARLDIPHALALDAAGNRLFIGELHGERVRVLDLTANVVSTLVTGTGGITSLAYEPTNNRLFASVFDAGKVLNIDVAQKTSPLLAGSGNYGEVDGPPTTAAFRSPHGVAVASKNTAFVADYHGPTIRKLVANGSGAFQTTTLAGLKNDEGLTDAIGPDARFQSPGEMALAPDNHTVYVVDGDANCAIRTFDTNTRQVGTLAGGADCKSSVDGTGVAAQFQRPGAMAMVTPTPGRPPVLLVTEERGVVRKVDTANAKVTTLNTGDDALPTWRGIAATATHIYVSGEVEQRIFRMPITGGALAPYAGTGTEGCADAAAAVSTLGRPAGIIWDGATTLFFADQDCQTIRRVNLTNNTVQTVAGGDADGNGQANPDGIGKNAAFSYPSSLTWDRQKKGFYVQDEHVVRWVDGTTFEVKTVVGDKDSHGGVWLPPNPPRLNFPGGFVEGLDGELYITSERAILKWVAP